MNSSPRTDTARYLHLAMDSLKGGGFCWLEEEKSLEWTEELVGLFGLKEPPKSFDDWLSYIHFEDRKRFRAFFSYEGLKGQDKKTSFRVTLNNETRFFKCTGTWDTESGTNTLYGVCWDVTESYLLNQKIEEERLRSAKFEKTSILAEVAASIAHEINNPITVILAGITHLKRSFESDQKEKMGDLINRVDRTATKVANIIQSVKKLSTYDGEHPLVESSLKSAIEDAQVIVAGRLRQDEIRFTTNLQDDTFFGHPNEMCQVIVNLLVNAIDAIEELPEKWIDITAARKGDNLELLFTDSGPGIPTFLRDKIFEPFFTTKEAGVGTGLGLSLCQTMIQNMEGSITIDADHEHTRFIISIPAMIKKPSIVFIDDEEDLCDLFKSDFSSDQYDLHVFSDSTEGMEFINDNHPNLVIVDYYMPDFNGFDIASRAVMRRIPAYIVTGTPELVQDQCQGFIDVIEKPLKLSTMREIIEKHIKTEPSTQLKRA